MTLPSHSHLQEESKYHPAPLSISLGAELSTGLLDRILLATSFVTDCCHLTQFAVAQSLDVLKVILSRAQIK